MISARMAEESLTKLEAISRDLRMSKNELLNQAVAELYTNYKINVMYLHAEEMGEDMTAWAKGILKYDYTGKNLAISKLHHA